MMVGKMAKFAPKFGKNTRDLEKKLTKISNDIKKLKLR